MGDMGEIVPPLRSSPGASQPVQDVTSVGIEQLPDGLGIGFELVAGENTFFNEAGHQKLDRCWLVEKGYQALHPLRRQTVGGGRAAAQRRREGEQCIYRHTSRTPP